MCVPTLLTIHYRPPRRSPVAQPSSWKQLSPFFSIKLVNFPFKPIRFSIFRARTRTCSGSPPPPRLPLPSKLNWHSPHTPPGLVPPPSTPSKSNLHGKPCQNRHTFENFSKFFDFFDFLCTGPAPTTPAPPAQSARALAPPAHPSAHLCAPFHAPACTLCTFCALLHTFSCTFMHRRTPFARLPHTFRAPRRTLRSIFRVCHPYLTFFLTLDPLLATMGNPALVQPGIVPTSRPLYNQVQPMQPPCCPSIFPVGLHNPHSCSRTQSGSHTTHPMAHGW